jgi:phosphoenolpyruvate carboxylase
MAIGTTAPRQFGFGRVKLLLNSLDTGRPFVPTGQNLSGSRLPHRQVVLQAIAEILLRYGTNVCAYIILSHASDHPLELSI